MSKMPDMESDSERALQDEATLQRPAARAPLNTIESEQLRLMAEPCKSKPTASSHETSPSWSNDSTY
jgi:hypothetical protein